jgi:hypothetical protein
MTWVFFDGKPATADTLPRWVQKVFLRFDVFTSSGTTSASAASKAFFDGVPIDAIMKAAGWSSQHTFNTFYCRKPVSDPALLSRTVLNAN